jgi:hypothetical protein
VATAKTKLVATAHILVVNFCQRSTRRQSLRRYISAVASGQKMVFYAMGHTNRFNCNLQELKAAIKGVIKGVVFALFLRNGKISRLC